MCRSRCKIKTKILKENSVFMIITIYTAVFTIIYQRKDNFIFNILHYNLLSYVIRKLKK